MKNWKTLERSLQCAENDNEKRKAYFGITKFLEKASFLELGKIIESAKDIYIKNRAETEFWWRQFDKKPENLLELIRTSDDKDKIEYAVIELGNSKYRGAADTLIVFLNDLDLREPAAMALRQMPTQKSFKPLLQSIKQNPESSECLLYALQVIDCSKASEFLVDLFISKPDAPVVRDDIFVCFAKGAVKEIPRKVKMRCSQKVMRAIKKSKNKSDKEELEQFYEAISRVKET